MYGVINKLDKEIFELENFIRTEEIMLSEEVETLTRSIRLGKEDIGEQDFIVERTSYEK